jgi:hypothetical protein
MAFNQLKCTIENREMKVLEFRSGQLKALGLLSPQSPQRRSYMERKEKLTVMFTEKYDSSVLAQFIGDKDFCATADHFIKKTLSVSNTLPHEIACDCLLWKTKELPILSVRGDTVDTTRATMIYQGKGLVEFVFNSGKCHYSFCRLHSIHRIERTDYSLIVVTQNAVVPCAEIVIFGEYQAAYRLSVEGHTEVEELDKFMAKLKELMLK